MTERRILVLEEDHDAQYYDVDTTEKLHAAALKIIRYRIMHEWITNPELDRIDSPMLSAEDIAKLPTAALRRFAAEHNETSKAEHEEHVRALRDYNDAKLALNTNDGKLAYTIMIRRKEYEYENFHFAPLA